MAHFYSWFIPCRPCICICIDDVVISPTRYAVSLKAELANIDNNEVITGVQMIMKDQVIYPKIVTSKLVPYGRIEPSTMKYKDIEPVQVFYNQSIGNDYMFIGTKNNNARRIRLENIYVDDGFVITGNFIFKQFIDC